MIANFVVCDEIAIEKEGELRETGIGYKLLLNKYLINKDDRGELIFVIFAFEKFESDVEFETSRNGLLFGAPVSVPFGDCKTDFLHTDAAATHVVL